LKKDAWQLSKSCDRARTRSHRASHHGFKGWNRRFVKAASKQRNNDSEAIISCYRWGFFSTQSICRAAYKTSGMLRLSWQLLSMRTKAKTATPLKAWPSAFLTLQFAQRSGKGGAMYWSGTA
jgi:hypothetical protein